MVKITIGNLIVETLNGNNSAENELYFLYKKKINEFLNKKYGNDNDRADDISEILIKMFENLHCYDEKKSKFDTWVIKIAKNHMIDKFRKKKPIYVTFGSSYNMENEFINNSENFTNSFDMIEPPCYSPTPHEKLETNDSLDFISNKIGIEQFSMLSMKYKDGYSYNEIAKEFRSDESKVSNKLSWTKNKLKNDNNKKG